MGKEAINHEQRAHALLSASGASRWLNCTVSPRLEEGFENKESDFAAEGTLAHEFAEVGVVYALGRLEDHEYGDICTKLKLSPHYSDEMLDEVQKHVDYVMEVYNEALSRSKDALIFVEDKVDLSMYIEEGFGLNDICIVADGILDIIDLKYGKGQRVKAIENKQMRLYGLGGVYKHELFYDLKEVRMHISQPRMDWVEVDTIGVTELKQWAQDVIIPTAKLAFEGLGEPNAGEWCRIGGSNCAAMQHCKAHADYFRSIEIKTNIAPHLISDDEVLEIYKKAKAVAVWLESIQDFVYSEALKGKKWPEFKLVEGRSNRTWKDDIAVANKLTELGYSEVQIANTKLKGIGDIEKLVGKAKFPILLDGLVIKPQGKPSLVPDSDKRPALGIEQAKSDFEDIE